MIVLNDIKLKYKLFFVYLFCVFAPIIIINVIFYNNVVGNVKEIQKNYYRLSTQGIAAQIESDLNQVIELANKLSLDQKLYEMLEKNYEKKLDYVETYYDYFIPYLFLNGESYQQVNRTVIYTDNQTILNSGLVFKINDQVSKESWYKKIINSPEKMHIIYGESITRPDNTIITPLSFFKVLNQGMDCYLKIARIELYTENILDIINREKIKGNIFILDKEGEILFADNNLAERQILDGYLSENRNRIIQREINGYLNWNIINVIDRDELNMALQEPRNKVISLTLISLLLSSLIIFFIYRSFYTRLNALSEHVSNLDQEDFSKQYTGRQGKDEIGSLINAFNKMVVKIKTLIMDVYEAKLEQSQIKLEKKQAELNALQSQMNPHFLFNTLESIRMKSLEKKEIETAQIIKYLARSFRRMISFKQEWIDVSEEVGYIKDFLEIQKYRFGPELEYTLDIDPDSIHVKIPKLIIQPFVENACIHGIEGSEEVGEVFVQINVVDNKLKCIIKDNGIGINGKKLQLILSTIKNQDEQGNNIGIENIYKRLELYYGDKFKLKIESEEGIGTCIILIIPLEG